MHKISSHLASVVGIRLVCSSTLGPLAGQDMTYRWSRLLLQACKPVQRAAPSQMHMKQWLKGHEKDLSCFKPAYVHKCGRFYLQSTPSPYHRAFVLPCRCPTQTQGAMLAAAASRCWSLDHLMYCAALNAVQVQPAASTHCGLGATKVWALQAPPSLRWPA